MSVAAITQHTPSSANAVLEYGVLDELSRSGTNKAAPTADDVKKAAGQFEAIIIRQLIGPSIEPLMAGGLGGGGKASGGGIYGHMLTEVLADKLAQGGGLGLGQMLQKQFSSSAVSAPLSSNSLVKS